MEELPLIVKIIALLACLGAVVLLATHDKLFKMLKRAPHSPKTK